MTVDFRALLKDTSKTVQRPKSAPECWLIGTMGSALFDITKNENETPNVSFELINIERHPDTEEETLEGVNLKSLRSPFQKTLAATYWLTPDSKYLLANMLDRVVGDDDRTLEERIPDTRGKLVQFKVRPAKGREGNEEDTGQNYVNANTLTIYEG